MNRLFLTCYDPFRLPVFYTAVIIVEGRYFSSQYYFWALKDNITENSNRLWLVYVDTVTDVIRVQNTDSDVLGKLSVMVMVTSWI